jgi:hypothetical protein
MIPGRTAGRGSTRWQRRAWQRGRSVLGQRGGGGGEGAGLSGAGCGWRRGGAWRKGAHPPDARGGPLREEVGRGGGERWVVWRLGSLVRLMGLLMAQLLLMVWRGKALRVRFCDHASAGLGLAAPTPDL